MSLHTALERLPGDRGTESTVREVLELMAIRVGEWLDAGDVATRLERPEASVRVVLSRLAEAHVLRADGER